MTDKQCDKWRIKTQSGEVIAQISSQDREASPPLIAIADGYRVETVDPGTGCWTDVTPTPRRDVA